jgi:hypothetical protein
MMNSAFEGTLNEQIGRILKALEETKTDIHIGKNEGMTDLCNAQVEIIREYAEMLEKRETELIEELKKAILNYGAKIAATRSLLRQLGMEEQKMADIKQDLMKDLLRSQKK